MARPLVLMVLVVVPEFSVAVFLAGVVAVMVFSVMVLSVFPVFSVMVLSVFPVFLARVFPVLDPH